MPASYYRDEDVLVRELASGSPQRWSSRHGAWVDYPGFEWAAAHALTRDQARALAPAAFGYPQLDGLRHVYLEDSYVVDIVVRSGEVRLDLEAIVLPEHPEYRPPHPGEHYCYLAGVLRFAGAHEVELQPSGRAPTEDLDGSLDYGNIDTFTANGDEFELTGEWGRLRLRSEPPQFHTFPVPEHWLPPTYAHPLDRTLANLRAERRLPPADRPTGASTESLDLVIRELERARTHGAPAADAAVVRRLVTDGWRWQAELSERVLALLSG